MARSRSIGNVYAELSVKDKMTHGLNKAEKSLKAFGSKVASIGAGFAVALPAAAVAGLATSMKSAIDAGGELADMMARTGAEGEGLFVMQRAFENAGIAADAVPAALNKMQKALAENNEGFHKLGLNIGNLKGLDPTAAFRATAEAIAKIPDPAQRAAMAMEIFGKSGGQLLAVMNDGEAFEVAANQVGKLGKFLADNAPELDKLGDSLSLFGSKAVEIGAALAVELTPEMQKLADAVSEMDLIGITSDAIGFAKALSDIVLKAREVATTLPIIKQLLLVGGGLDGAIGYAASFNPLPGTALPYNGPVIGATPKVLPPSPDYSALGAATETGVPFLQEMLGIIKDNPLFNPQPQAEALGIPFLSDLLAPLPFDVGTSKPAQAADFQATQYDVNEMQRRGLGMGREDVAAKANKQVEYLKGIWDVLRNAKLQDKQLVWD